MLSQLFTSMKIRKNGVIHAISKTRATEISAMQLQFAFFAQLAQFSSFTKVVTFGPSAFHLPG